MVEFIVTVQTGLRIYCADRTKNWRKQTSKLGYVRKWISET